MSYHLLGLVPGSENGVREERLEEPLPERLTQFGVRDDAAHLCERGLKVFRREVERERSLALPAGEKTRAG
jgi:hypothetical protein